MSSIDKFVKVDTDYFLNLSIDDKIAYLEMQIKHIQETEPEKLKKLHVAEQVLQVYLIFKQLDNLEDEEDREELKCVNF